MLTTIRGTTARAHISHVKEPTGEYTGAPHYMLGEKALRLVASAQKMWAAEHASKQGEGAEFLRNEGVLTSSGEVTEPYCQEQSLTIAQARHGVCAGYQRLRPRRC
jgi:hypothetical protein